MSSFTLTVQTEATTYEWIMQGLRRAHCRFHLHTLPAGHLSTPAMKYVIRSTVKLQKIAPCLRSYMDSLWDHLSTMLSLLTPVFLSMTWRAKPLKVDELVIHRILILMVRM